MNCVGDIWVYMVYYMAELEMNSEPAHDYATQATTPKWVRESALGRRSDVLASLREAFASAIQEEEVEVIVFSTHHHKAPLASVVIADRLAIGSGSRG